MPSRSAATGDPIAFHRGGWTAKNEAKSTAFVGCLSILTSSSTAVKLMRANLGA